MINNLEYFWYKYLTGPTCDCNKHWMMSDTNSIKFGESNTKYSNVLIFDRSADMCQLKNSFGNVVDTIKVDNLLPYLRDKKYLVGWKPVSILTYDEKDYIDVGYDIKQK